jgi:hypothetical protein
VSRLQESHIWKSKHYSATHLLIHGLLLRDWDGLAIRSNVGKQSFSILGCFGQSTSTVASKQQNRKTRLACPPKWVTKPKNLQKKNIIQPSPSPSQNTIFRWKQNLSNFFLFQAIPFFFISVSFLPIRTFVGKFYINWWLVKDISLFTFFLYSTCMKLWGSTTNGIN